MKILFALVLFSVCYTQIWAQQVTENISFTHEGLTVYGTFRKPAQGVFPVIIINPGTGANDRDGTLEMVGANVQCLYPALLNTTIKYYKGLAEALVDSGYAVLTYDKIEYTYPAPQSWGAITFRKLWLPVESAINYVKTRSDVDENNIVLIGHSEGSTLIPYIARNRTDIKAMISLAGPRAPLDSLLAYQILDITQTCNGDMNSAQQQANGILQYFQMVRNQAWTSATPAFGGVSASVWYDYISVADSVSINYNLANLRTLFIGLGDDKNVPPAELQRFQNEITTGADFYSIPGINHFLTTATSPAVAAVVPDTIVYWLRQQNITAAPGDLYVADKIIVKSQGQILSVSLPGNNIFEARLYDVTGKLVSSKQQTFGATITLPAKNAPSGAYILAGISDKGAFRKKIIIL